MKSAVSLFFVAIAMLLATGAFAQGVDFGDDPDPPYPTMLATGGASHFILPGMQLGVYVDGEIDGQPFIPGLGDDMSQLDDADGVIFNSWILASQGATVIVIASAPGMIDGWIDFNIDGDWADPGEQIFMALPVSPGHNLLAFVVPAVIAIGQSYARIRYSTPGMLQVGGPAPDGEVEDYPLWLGAPQTQDIYIDPNPCSTLTQNEISLAMIPQTGGEAPALLVAAYNDEPFPGGPGMGVSYSTDGGSTWINTHLVYPIDPFTGATFLDMFDPSVCIDDSGHVFVSQISTDNNWIAGPASGLFVHKSTDGAVTWQAPVQVSADNAPVSNPDTSYRFNDRDQMVSDNFQGSPFYNRLYITWIKDRGWNSPSPWSDIYVAYSTDGGGTWSTPQRINAWANNMGNMPVPAVANDGTLYVIWMDYNVKTGGSGTIYLDKSTDGGVTFGTEKAIATIPLPPINLNAGTDVRAKGATVIKVNPTNPNDLYIVYASDPDGSGADEADIFLIRSTDGGLNWGVPVRVNDDATTGAQVMPWMYIKPNGTIDLVWYDRRNDPANQLWDVYFTSSTDYGSSFYTNTLINSASFLSPTPWKVSDKWMGEYPGLVAGYPAAYIIYTSSVRDNNGDVLFGTTENPVPDSRTLDDAAIDSGQVICYDATTLLTVAATGPVVIQSGATVTFISGGSILFKPGFHAQQGSAVQASITTTGNYCSNPAASPSPVMMTVSDQKPQAEPFHPRPEQVRLYPNPTSGKVRIDLPVSAPDVGITLYTYLGVVWYENRLEGTVSPEFDISHLPSGIYLVRIRYNDTMTTEKIIRW